MNDQPLESKQEIVILVVFHIVFVFFWIKFLQEEHRASVMMKFQSVLSSKYFVKIIFAFLEPAYWWPDVNGACCTTIFGLLLRNRFVLHFLNVLVAFWEFRRILIQSNVSFLLIEVCKTMRKKYYIVHIICFLDLTFLSHFSLNEKLANRQRYIKSIIYCNRLNSML